MLSIEWTSRSKSLQLRLRKKVVGTSFWLTPATSPVTLGIIPSAQIGNWDGIVPVAIPSTYDVSKETVTATLPSSVTSVRLDFNLRATAGGKSATVLAFRQLFQCTPGGADQPDLLLPSIYSFAADVITPSPTLPGRQPAIPTRRQILGTHPLLRVMPGSISVNAEFVDATELWWSLHGPNDPWKWYLDPDVGGRQQHMRVLAWTGGGSPMIWFTAIPDAAAFGPIDTPSGEKGSAASDIVFLKPLGEITHNADASGFSHSAHQSVTMYSLPRYMIKPCSEEVMKRAVAANRVHIPEFIVDKLVAKSTSPTVPEDPMDLAIALKWPRSKKAIRGSS